MRLAGALWRFWLVRGYYSEGWIRLLTALSQEGASGRAVERAKALNRAGVLAANQGEYASARALFEESLALYRELGDMQGSAVTLRSLGDVAYSQGDYAAARSLLEECLALFQELGFKQGIAYSLETFASVHSAQARAERAARLWGAAEALREDIGSPLPPNEREAYDGKVAVAREALGSEVFSTAWAEGRAISLEQAIEYALDATGDGQTVA